MKNFGYFLCFIGFGFAGFSPDALAKDMLIGAWTRKIEIPCSLQNRIYDVSVNLSSTSQWQAGNYFQLYWYKKGKAQKGEISELLPNVMEYRFRVSREQRQEKLEIRLIGTMSVEVRSLAFRENPQIDLNRQFSKAERLDLVQLMALLPEHENENLVGIVIDGNAIAKKSVFVGDLHEGYTYPGPHGLNVSEPPHATLDVPAGAYIKSLEVELEIDPQRFFLEPAY